MKQRALTPPKNRISTASSSICGRTMFDMARKQRYLKRRPNLGQTLLEEIVCMVRMFKPLTLVGAIVVLSAAPAFADDINLNPLGLDLDPFHIFTPAPAPAPAPVMHKHHHHHMKK
jgi:hypothetical protein